MTSQQAAPPMAATHMFSAWRVIPSTTVSDLYAPTHTGMRRIATIIFAHFGMRRFSSISDRETASLGNLGLPVAAVARNALDAQELPVGKGERQIPPPARPYNPRQSGSADGLLGRRCVFAILWLKRSAIQYYA